MSNYFSNAYRDMQENFSNFAVQMIDQIISNGEKIELSVDSMTTKLSKIGFKSIHAMLGTILEENPAAEKSIRFMRSLLHSGYYNENGELKEFDPDTIATRFRAFAICAVLLDSKDKLPVPNWKDGTINFVKLEKINNG